MNAGEIGRIAGPGVAPHRCNFNRRNKTSGQLVAGA